MHQEANKIAIIGDKDSVTAFGAIGVTPFPILSNLKVKETLCKLINEKYAIILITEELMQANEMIIKKYNSGVYPIILPIPSSRGVTGYAVNRLKQSIERALGVDAETVLN